MQEFKEFLKEATDHKRVSLSRKFKDSVEAANFTEDVGNFLGSVPMQQLAREADAEHGTKCVPALKKAIAAYIEFLDELDSAG